MKRENFETDQWLFQRYTELFVIKTCDGEIVYEPKRNGDYTDASPFPKGYIPRIGDKFSIQRGHNKMNLKSFAIDGYEDENPTPINIYVVLDIYLKNIETSQQHFQTVIYLTVKTFETV